MRKLVVWLLILLVVLVGVDRVAVVVTSSVLASSIQSSERLSRRPGVALRGFPFLTQVVNGRYDRVDVTTRDLPAAQGVKLDEVDASLRGVHVALGDALRRQVDRAPVDSATAVARVSFASLDAAAGRLLGANQVTLSFGPAAGDRVVVTGKLTSAAGPVSLSGQARLSVSGGRLRVTVLPDTLTGLSPRARAEVVRLVDLAVDVPALPFGFQVVAVSVDAGGVALRARGDHVVLTRFPVNR